MWMRRDFGMLLAAAVASFGVTVGMFWPRTVHAVDGANMSPADIKVPVLKVGSVEVTAAMDGSKAHTVVLTAKNTSNEQVTATFEAAALVQGPISMMSRGFPVGQEVWKGEYTVDLKPGESQVIPVALPAAAFDLPALDANAAKFTRPGQSTLTLSTRNGKGGVSTIQALTLETSAMPPKLLTIQTIGDGGSTNLAGPPRLLPAQAINLPVSSTPAMEGVAAGGPTDLSQMRVAQP